ncbi:MAG: secretion system protein E, partial [Pseudomonadota bacterium]
NVIGVVGQRLVRRLCGECRQPYAPGEAERAAFAAAGLDPPPALYRAVGCDRCGGRGFHGRVALMELARFDRAVDELIARRATLTEVERHLLARGFEPLARDALRRIADGQTSFEEAARVVDLTEVEPA